MSTDTTFEMIEFKDNQEPAIDAGFLNAFQKKVKDNSDQISNINNTLNNLPETNQSDGILTGSVVGYKGEVIPEGYEKVPNPNVTVEKTEVLGGIFQEKYSDGRLITYGRFATDSTGYYTYDLPNDYIIESPKDIVVLATGEYIAQSGTQPIIITQYIERHVNLYAKSSANLINNLPYAVIDALIIGRWK